MIESEFAVNYLGLLRIAWKEDPQTIGLHRKVVVVLEQICTGIDAEE